MCFSAFRIWTLINVRTVVLTNEVGAKDSQDIKAVFARKMLIGA